MGDFAVKDVKSMCSKNTKILCFPKDMGSDLADLVFISGPLPPVRRGVERFSRLLAPNTWLSTACTVHSVHFIDNFNFFWDCRHLFKADGCGLYKSGVKLFTSNIIYFLHHPSPWTQIFRDNHKFIYSGFLFPTRPLLGLSQ